MGLFDRIKKGVSNTWDSVKEGVGNLFSGGDEEKPEKEQKTQNITETQKPQKPQEREDNGIGSGKMEMTTFGRFQQKQQEMTPEERKQEIEILKQEIELEEQEIEEGDNYDFLRDRQEKIEEKEEKIARLEAGLNPEKKSLVGSPVPITPAGSAAAAINSIKITNKGLKTASYTDEMISIARGTKRAVKTSNWLNRLGKGGKFARGSANLLMGAIGSYPFAGFIKEEALQTLSMGTYQALSSKNPEQARIAIEKTKETLDPDKWDKILAKVPYANVLNELKNFYDAANTKVSIDEKLVEDMERGLSDEEVEEERKQEEEQDEIDFVEQQRKIQELKTEAARTRRKEAEEYWDRIHKENMERKEKEREARLKFWEEYWKRKNEIMAANSPSQLNFGLL